MAAVTYRITIRERLDESWSAHLGNISSGISILPDPGNGTVITGVVRDQAALRGLLNQLFNFNLHLTGLESLDEPTFGAEN